MEGAIPRGTGREGELSADQLVELVRRLQRTIHELQTENERLKQHLTERDGQKPAQRLDEECSLKAEDHCSRGRRRKKQAPRMTERLLRAGQAGIGQLANMPVVMLE